MRSGQIVLKLGFLALKAVLDTSPLSSGRVRRTLLQISAGADAPVAPALTRSLMYCSQRHVCLSIRLSVRRLAPIPAGESQDVTNKSCSICHRGDPWGPWRSRT